MGAAGDLMGSFDPATATAAYLAGVGPAQNARAVAYTIGGHWALLGGWAVAVAAAALVLRSGLLPGVKRRIAPRGGRPFRVSLAVGFSFLASDFIIESPWSVYIDWFRERAYGLTSQAFSGWLAEKLLDFALSSLLLTLFIGGFYALVRRSPGRWWVWGGGAATLAALALLYVLPPLLEPLFNHFSPAPAGPVRRAVEALARDAGVPAGQIYIYDGSRQSNRYTAHVSGVGAGARIAMSDVMFKRGADIAEVRAVAGHEMGHYKRHHALFGALVYGLLAIVVFGLIDRLFPLAARLMGSEGAAIADPCALPVVVATGATLLLLATPALNGFTRFEEADADRFSLEHAREPDGLSRALVKTIAYRAASPSPLEEALFYDHPSVARRVRAAMTWKAAHPAPIPQAQRPDPASRP